MKIIPEYSQNPIKIDPIVGCIVTSAVYDKTESGYPYVRLTFDTGQVLTVKEEGQCGEISMELT